MSNMNSLAMKLQELAKWISDYSFYKVGKSFEIQSKVEMS
jgi:hypothetical protein